MHVEITGLESGWPDITIEIRKEEIDKLCTLLRQLQSEKRDHFHIFNNFIDDAGVGDIEFSLNNNADDSMSCDW